MRILIDIGHPAHIHLFKNFAREIIKQNNKVLFTFREKEHELELFRSFNFEYVSFGRHYQTKYGKIWGLIKFTFLLLVTSLKYKPDIFLSHGSLYAAFASWILGRPHISLEDSGNMEQIRLYKPFTKAIICPDVLPEKFGRKEIRYPGYHELFYLHPDLFNPDKSILGLLGINPDDKYYLLRFVAFKATHDLGQKGMSDYTKYELIKLLKTKGKVFISSESILPDDLKEFELPVHPSRIHDVIAFADLVISEGATIASEAGVLGTPAIYINSIPRSYNEDLEKYGLVFNFRTDHNLISKVIELTSGLSVSDYKENRNAMLNDKINPTRFLIWFICEWPESQSIYKRESGHYMNFK